MALKYPKNPRFNKLQMRSPDYASWQEGCAHDPSLLEWEGRYYAYSTDPFGAPNGYQIRVSDDLLHWEYAGSAFRLDGAAPLTQRETAEKCGISRSYVSRIEKRALEKLREALEGN